MILRRDLRYSTQIFISNMINAKINYFIDTAFYYFVLLISVISGFTFGEEIPADSCVTRLPKVQEQFICFVT